MFWKFAFLSILKKISALTLKKSLQFSMDSFRYLAQMVTSMRGCVAYNDLWPWPISSRSFGLGLENRVRSVASTVLDGLFPYLVQMVTNMRRCVTCDDLWPWHIFKVIRPCLWKSCRSVMFSVLDRLFPYFPQIITTSNDQCVSRVKLIARF